MGGLEVRCTLNDEYINLAIPMIQVMLDLLVLELKAGRVNEYFIQAMSAIFDPKASIHEYYFQMTKEEVKAYQPFLEHEGDPIANPREQNRRRGDHNMGYGRDDMDDDDYGGRGGGRGGRGDGGRDREEEVKLEQTIPHQKPGSDVVVYCLPRENICVSRRAIDLLNYFGLIGGFQKV